MDYADACEQVALAAQERSYRTLERLCSAIADRLLDRYPRGVRAGQGGEAGAAHTAAGRGGLGRALAGGLSVRGLRPGTEKGSSDVAERLVIDRSGSASPSPAWCRLRRLSVGAAGGRVRRLGDRGAAGLPPGDGDAAARPFAPAGAALRSARAGATRRHRGRRGRPRPAEGANLP